MFNVTKTTVNTGLVVWQEVEQLVQGGFTLNDAAFATPGQTIPAGTLIGYNEATRMAKVCKLAVAQAAATNTDTTVKVLKGHTLAVGSSVKSGSSAAKTVSAIDTADPNFDLLTLSATLGVAIAVGDAIFVDDEGYQAEGKGLSYSDVDIDANGIASVGVVIDGSIYARRIAPVPSSIKAKLPQITFSQSF